MRSRSLSYFFYTWKYSILWFRSHAKKKCQFDLSLLSKFDLSLLSRVDPVFSLAPLNIVCSRLQDISATSSRAVNNCSKQVTRKTREDWGERATTSAPLRPSPFPHHIPRVLYSLSGYLSGPFFYLRALPRIHTNINTELSSHSGIYMALSHR